MKVETIAFDYGAVSGYDAIKNELKDLEIGVLGLLICCRIILYKYEKRTSEKPLKTWLWDLK